MDAPVAPTGLRRMFVKKVGKRLLHGVLLKFLSRQSLIPDEPVLDAKLFPWAPQVVERWPAMRAELDEQLRHRDELPSFHEISPDQYRISPDDHWKTFVLLGFGEPSQLNRALCPETARALDRVPGLSTAFFSVLGPRKHVPSHRGVTKGLVRCHMALKIPKHRERCRMYVEEQDFCWEEGKLVFFDDTYEHEVRNDTDEERAVLIFDFERPMTRSGRWIHHLALRALRHTAYFRDAQRNQHAWEEEYRKLLEREAA